jgi:hypothetical protein
MRNAFLASFVAALALAATSARADEVTYPNQEKTFATRLDSEPIVTSDVTYLGAHAVITKDSPGPARGFVAAYEDVQYLTDDPLPIKAAPRCPAVMVATQDCTCHRG